MIAAIHPGCLSGIKYQSALLPARRSCLWVGAGCQVDRSLWDLPRLGIPGLYHHLEHWIVFLCCLKPAIGLKRLNLPTQSHFGTLVFAMSTVSSTWLQGTYDVFSVGSCWIFYEVFLDLGFSCTQKPTVVTEHSSEISYLIYFPSSQEFLLFFL